MGRRILYVEDGPDDVLFMERAFRKVAPEVRLDVIPDGQQAVDYFDPARLSASARELLDLVILDLNLPGRSGLEVLRQIRRNPDTSRLPVVMFSASNQQKDIDACFAAACSAYHVKPNDFEGLRHVVENICQSWLLNNPGA
jgi:CheY-like chemotaxis protein